MILKLLPVAVVAFAWSVGVGPSAWADDDTPSYTMQDVTACSKDAVRLCSSNLSDIEAIETCMKAKYDQLSPKCQARFRNR